ncbi:protein-L-isoaspartate(D-aspartate) O-methyltransferase [Naumannella cuiyingiana]|uniref:Protein-L-isoaspartate O-methyltransferase n=1 Tax=Naumannella cuiyingiana TaxID=1347891 RepID=A0A7Z0IK35_9ACTN|nr:protein-L-isoaspartate O-methyltransferase [Naumannella cuiyingiana]NYI70101.1 protein-L-isoaspartate(D-aspartate) O-methyltransferase [Naumannella cuiyingiana]
MGEPPGEPPQQAPDPVAEAFRRLPRAGFLPSDQRASAAVDAALPIAAGQSNSQPRTVAAMLRLLAPVPGDRVLDVGSGSGWTTALLAVLVGPAGSVLGVERHPELVAFGRANLASARLPWARIEPATPGVLGDPSGAPYRRILVSASARRLPAALVAQLDDGGVLICPVGSTMTRVRRDGDRVRVSEHGEYRFVPLVED